MRKKIIRSEIEFEDDLINDDYGLGFFDDFKRQGKFEEINRSSFPEKF